MDKKEKQVGDQTPSPTDVIRREKHIRLVDLIGLTKHNEGKLLTVLEASIPEGKQLEAIKSVVRSILWDNNYEVERWVFKQEADNCKLNFPFPYGMVR